MERISFHVSKKEGVARVRFRLRSGRSAQLCHSSDIVCDVADLEKLYPDGSCRERVRVYNVRLSDLLRKEYLLMSKAYIRMCEEGMAMTTDIFEREITALKSSASPVVHRSPDIVSRFRMYADDALHAGLISEMRHKHIVVVIDKLDRFVHIKGITAITASDFGPSELLAFREYLFDEYRYVPRYPFLFRHIKGRNRPTARLSMNTVTSQLKMFQTFFAELEDQEEISKSPFKKMGRERKKAMMRTMYDTPVFLRKGELMTLISSAVPPDLSQVRDAFVVQCAFGCRISDFKALSMDSISVSEEGIPYIHYLPRKTAGTQGSNEEVCTPVVRYAFDIITRTGFNFPVLNRVSGPSCYNALIRALLRHCGIDRQVPRFNEQTRQNDYGPLYEVGSSKLARKTHVDMMNKVQVDMYAAGLHKVGSSAVTRYTSMEIRDRFLLMNVAFGQPYYTVDASLDVVG